MNYVNLEFRLALIQCSATVSKQDNLKKAVQLISIAAKQGAQLLALPVSCLIILLYSAVVV